MAGPSETAWSAPVCVDRATADSQDFLSYPVMEWGGGVPFSSSSSSSSATPDSRKRRSDVMQGWPWRYLDRTQMPGRYCSSVRTGRGDVRIPPTHTNKLCRTSVNRERKKEKKKTLTDKSVATRLTSALMKFERAWIWTHVESTLILFFSSPFLNESRASSECSKFNFWIKFFKKKPQLRLVMAVLSLTVLLVGIVLTSADKVSGPKSLSFVCALKR